ncbi:MAG: septal ring lytic transglycosylase RlpA family protein [Rickettsiales bacterium]|jgi:rare lipoprotein A (peptidoglycan hydrolase)/predicted small secreted protein|nr:septal ring lytic transglycosylase RlpA family protein [Rickettsiales bacterium]
MKKLLALFALPFILAACGGLNGVGGDFPGGGTGLSEESLGGGSDASVKTDDTATGGAGEQDLIYAGPKYYVGVPYKVEDVLYTPVEDYNYNQTGTAGIVPVDLNGVSTTNGEKFDTNAMFATSKVLPLPSIARITNLDNGQSVVVRVNNRGPFVNSRLLDVSPAAARKLGMTGQTKVQVQILEDKSRKVKELTLGATGETASVSSALSGPVEGGTGAYTVQVGAYYSEDSAISIKNRISHIGPAVIVQEGGMYKIRITNMSAGGARTAIERLRNEENMAPGLLKDGRWVNADSI